jgi:hypothetical protein
MGIDDFTAWVDGRWPIEVVGYWGGLDLGVAVERDLRHVGGDLFLDGSLGAHTAALVDPYHDRPSTSGDLELDELDALRRRGVATTKLRVSANAAAPTAIRERPPDLWRQIGRRHLCPPAAASRLPPTLARNQNCV